MHIAVIGCGQLSRMLALAGIPLGFTFTFIAEDEGEDTRCVNQMGEVVHWHPDRSIKALYNELGRPDVVTTEKEQLDPALLEALQRFCAVQPNPAAFSILHDRSREKELLDRLKIPGAPYLYASSAAEAVASLGLPVVTKSCRDGYDGKHQRVLRDVVDAADFDARTPTGHHIIEKWIPFDKEVSLISARGLEGDICHYPIAENMHDEGILSQTIAPGRDISNEIQATAQDYITRIMEALDYIGVMAMECFIVGDKLLVNEIAPRVHNSGHWTQGGSATSQFENHIRAITGLPLGSTANHGVWGMVNLIGTNPPPQKAFSSNSTLHWYNKSIRPGRKLGHVNFSGASHDDLIRQMSQFRRSVLDAGPNP